MARPIYLLAPSAVALAIFGCGGAPDPGLFGNSGVSGASSAGAASAHGAGASSTPSGGDTSNAGSVGLAGDDAGGESAGGSSGGTGGTADGEAGHSTSGGSVDQAGTGGGAGHAEGGSAGHAAGGGGGHTEGGASTGGTAGAGTAGSAGSGVAGAAGGGSEPTCAQLLAQAATELTEARACNLAADAEQCTGAVQTVCNCQVPVEKNDSVATKAYEATLKQINAKHCSQVCPAIACLPVTDSQCRPSSVGSSIGSCVASFGLPIATPAF